MHKMFTVWKGTESWYPYCEAAWGSIYVAWQALEYVTKREWVLVHTAYYVPEYVTSSMTAGAAEIDPSQNTKGK